MYVGAQYFGTSRTEMEFLVRHGVNHFDATVADMEVDTLQRYREEAAAYGVELEMVHVKPMLNMTMAKDPERDREIDGFCRCIENASQAGLRGLNYNFCVLNAEGRGGLVQRTGRSPAATSWNGSSPSPRSIRCNWRATSTIRRVPCSTAWRSGTGRSLKG